MLFLILLIISAIIAGIILFEPNIDITKEKEVLLWYNHNHQRKFVKLL